MNEVVYLFFRQMRRPALVLIACYTVAILGMSMIPTLDDNGELIYFSIFDSFYWITITATTMGYGEEPYGFSHWQRLWVILSIYYTVPAWLYAAGKIIAILQDPVFQHALKENSFARRTERLKQRFVIICGLGEAGAKLAKLLLKNNYQCVVIEKNENRVASMALEPEFHNVLSTVGDASDVQLLEKAGIRSPFCRAVIAITNDEAVNIKVALSAKLLSSEHYRFQIICRTTSAKGSAHAKSFHTDMVVNTNQVFTERLTMALRRPAIASLMARAYAEPNSTYEPLPQPPSGKWLLCGFGELGQTLQQFLEYEGVESVVIDEGSDERIDIHGTGTEAVTLREARIDRAQAIVAAHTYDPDNLSIAMTAKAMRPSLYVVGKQNRTSNEHLFQVAGFDRVMEEADLLVSQIFPQVARPLLARFIRLLRHQDEAWGQSLVQRLDALGKRSDGQILNPKHFIARIDYEHAPAVMDYLKSGHLLRLQTLWMHPNEPETLHEVVPLLLYRQEKEYLLPNPAMHLEVGDQVLLAYVERSAGHRIGRNCFDYAALYWAQHGRERMNSSVLNYIYHKLQ